jgi:hypothetical protein
VSAQLARALWRPTLSLLQTVAEGEQAGALGAVADFVASPTPASFLRARRQLDQAVLRSHVHRKQHARHAAELGAELTALAELRSLDARKLDVLAHLPVEARAAQRVKALAALIATHEELESRAEMARVALLRRLRGRSGLAP